MNHGHKDIPELSAAEKIRLQACESDFAVMAAALRDGTATPDDVAGAFARLGSLDIHPDTQINALHIPTDAGPHAPAIERILRRIPDGWGRWISVDAGWYPIVVACDQRLSAIDPHYVVHQIKEKFGTLRYYCAPGDEDPSSHVVDAIEAITTDAERTSAITCERCTEPGVLQRNRYWAKTLCTLCADTLGYTPPGLCPPHT